MVFYWLEFNRYLVFKIWKFVPDDTKLVTKGRRTFIENILAEVI